MSRMPVLFVGHGSPMNAIAENDFTSSMNKLGKELGTPKAILCVSAHWMTKGTLVTNDLKPKTIHDFYGFPEPLFKIEYPAPGNPSLASEISKESGIHKIREDGNWGLDHGTWSILRHLFPEAKIPVVQLSLSMSEKPEYHYQLGQELQKLREKGVLILGSGNVVHNLRTINWDTNAKPYDWALEFDSWIKDKILKRDDKALTHNFLDSEAGRLSNPSLDHYLPLLYALGASDKNDPIHFDFEGMQNASISMRSVRWG